MKKINNYLIQKFEVDEKRFIYGEYDYKCNIEPFVYLQASYEGYKYRTLLSKPELIRENVIRYYDYLADNIIHNFAEALFRGDWKDEYR